MIGQKTYRGRKIFKGIKYTKITLSGMKIPGNKMVTRYHAETMLFFYYWTKFENFDLSAQNFIEENFTFSATALYKRIIP